MFDIPSKFKLLDLYHDARLESLFLFYVFFRAGKVSFLNSVSVEFNESYNATEKDRHGKVKAHPKFFMKNLSANFELSSFQCSSQ